MESGNNPNSQKASQNFIERNKSIAGSFVRRPLTHVERQIRSHANTQSPAPPGTRGILPGETNFIERNRELVRGRSLRSAMRTGSKDSSDRKPQFSVPPDEGHEESKVQRAPTPYVKAEQKPSQMSVRLSAADIVGVENANDKAMVEPEEMRTPVVEQQTPGFADANSSQAPLNVSASQRSQNPFSQIHAVLSKGAETAPPAASRDDEEYYTPPEASPVKPGSNPFDASLLPMLETGVPPDAAEQAQTLATNDQRTTEQIAADVQAATDKMMSQSLNEPCNAVSQKENIPPTPDRTDREEMKVHINECSSAKERIN